MSCEAAAVPDRGDVGRGDADSGEQKAVLLFFYSPTSGPSRRMDSLVSWLCVRERKRLRLHAVNADEHPDVVTGFGLTRIPALVLVKDGQAVARIEGRATGSQIDETILPHLRS
jgi:thioredoxin-like negative regulator of GroEL